MEIGARGELRYTVQHQDLASEVAVDKEDSFPDVLATSRVIGLMEVAAARLMKPLLQEGQLSVGVGIDMKHTAPTPVAEDVVVTAEFLGMDGKLYRFRMEVSDRAGYVARGEHTRAIIEESRLLEGARKRMEVAGA